MGVALAVAAMLCFSTNMIVTRYAVKGMPLESGFLVVLATNVLFPVALFAGELGLRTQPYAWSWKGAGLFAIGGVIGTFLGRKALFDTVTLLGPSRASIFHSSSPAFALVGAWLLAGEGLGWYELALVAVVWLGLWIANPPGGSTPEHLAPEVLRKGIVAGVLATAGFALGNVIRGIAMRGWNEAVLGSALSSVSAFLLQLAVTRDWPAIRRQLATAGPRALALYVACGVATSIGSILVSIAMTKLEIGLTVLVVHTTPLIVFPVSVLLLKHREAITGRTLAGTALVLAGVGALALR
ncbi:MAG: DMT family transporter [Clostridia bacterium]